MPVSRVKLLECAVMASRRLHAARYGNDAVDLGYPGARE